MVIIGEFLIDFFLQISDHLEQFGVILFLLVKLSISTYETIHETNNFVFESFLNVLITYERYTSPPRTCMMDGKTLFKFDYRANGLY